jgi:hypothetical protein
MNRTFETHFTEYSIALAIIKMIIKAIACAYFCISIVVSQFTVCRNVVCLVAVGNLPSPSSKLQSEILTS